MMRSSVALCVLGLLCFHSTALGQEAAEVPPGVLIFCDDPSVDKAVTSAMTQFNEGLISGNKLAVFQILSASKSENGSETVYSLKFTSRRSDCPAGSSKPWTDCEYLPINKKPLSCNATVYMTETAANTSQVDCVIDDYIVPERASCLGCPEEIDVESEDLKGPISASISKFNSISDSTHLFTLHSVGYATRQVVAGFRFKLQFDMSKTTCAKAEHSDLNELCVPDNEAVEFANCNSTVDVAPWRLEPPTAQVECEKGALLTVLRRRPPGWSPLRSVLREEPPSASPPAPKAAAKEESSEEDTGASKPSASADAAVTDSPFHCPSKPWKPFNPAPPTQAPVEAAPTQPAADGTFSDKDLLG